MRHKPRQYKAKNLKGEWVHGWYAVLHQVETDHHDKVTRVREIPALFNDKPGERPRSGYWQYIDPETLEEMEEE